MINIHFLVIYLFSNPDLSMHERIDHHFGGDVDAGVNRGRAVLHTGVPTIIAPGNIDFLVTGPSTSDHPCKRTQQP
ncbi:hypothetical protein DESC_120120 [Desulfosarcina cetonica]|uniref:Tm-1-like ATP-binding domain-containing protein n=1 Tax=Desulfosarcina cetonica TaxID=90730 RepID=UPI0009F9393B|nr:hypothetical protein DESC_120120 [Desulfosarcina cetonica]